MLILPIFSYPFINLDKQIICIILIMCGQDLNFLSSQHYAQALFAHLFMQQIAPAKFTVVKTQKNANPHTKTKTIPTNLLPKAP